MSGGQRTSHGASVRCGHGGRHSSSPGARRGGCGCRPCARPALHRARGDRRGAARVARAARRRLRRPRVPARLFLRHGFTLWDNYWYAGRYSFVGYSVLYYPLAAVLRDPAPRGARRRGRRRRVRRCSSGGGGRGALADVASRSSGRESSSPGRSRLPSASRSRCSACSRSGGPAMAFAALLVLSRSHRARSRSSCSASSSSVSPSAVRPAAAAAAVPAARSGRSGGRAARCTLPGRPLGFPGGQAVAAARLLRRPARLTWRIERARGSCAGSSPSTSSPSWRSTWSRPGSVRHRARAPTRPAGRAARRRAAALAAAAAASWSRSRSRPPGTCCRWSAGWANSAADRSENAKVWPAPVAYLQAHCGRATASRRSTRSTTGRRTISRRRTSRSYAAGSGRTTFPSTRSSTDSSPQGIRRLAPSARRRIRRPDRRPARSQLATGGEDRPERQTGLTARLRPPRHLDLRGAEAAADRHGPAAGVLALRESRLAVHVPHAGTYRVAVHWSPYWHASTGLPLAPSGGMLQLRTGTAGNSPDRLRRRREQPVRRLDGHGPHLSAGATSFQVTDCY